MKTEQVYRGFFKSEDLEKVYATYDELMNMPHGTHEVPVWQREVVVSHPPKGNRVRVEHLGESVVVGPGEIVGIAPYEIWKVHVFDVNNDPIRDLLTSLNLGQVEVVWTDEGLVDLVPEFCQNTWRTAHQKRSHQTRTEYLWECPMGGATQGNVNTEGVYWILWRRLCSGKKQEDVTPIKLVMRSKADPYQVVLNAYKRLSLPYPQGR